MRRTDWTPVVLITSTVSVTVVAAVLLTGRYLPSPFHAEPGPSQARRRLAPRVDVWVGELAPGLVGVLGPVWGETGPDEAHDARLNDALSLSGERGLAWYQLLVFNTSEEERQVSLADGAITIRPEEGAPPVPLRSVAALVGRKAVSPSPALRTVLEARGTLEEEITVPPGWMTDLLVAFERRVALDQAVEVASAGGASFRRRRMERKDLEGLVEDPEVARIGDL